MNLDMSEFLAIFVEEAQEHLAAMEARLLALDVAHATPADFNDIFRAAHSIKGGSATFGLSSVTSVAHVLESLLDRLRNRQLSLTTPMVDALLQATDHIGSLIAAREEPDQAGAAEGERLCRRLAELAGDAQAPATPPAPAEARAPAKGEGTAFGFFDDLPASAGVPAAAPAPAAAPVQQCAAAAGDVPPAAVATVASAAAGSAPSAPIASEHSSIRVSVEKVDQLINLVGELVITQAMLAQTAGGGDVRLGERLSSALAQLDRNTRDLQEAAMAIRMMPISAVFNRFPRVVRDLAARLGKSVDLRMSGEHTELDKGLIEKIVDPLTHLVRNSLDHGIESAAERIACGKPAAGTISLSASHQGGDIVIEVADDGRGLSRSRILDKALERGMGVPENPTDSQVWNLIFEPGFSTAEAVTDVSGRGVGMDVVRSNIAALGGRVEIHSAPGQGTRIAVRLPLTLAILDGLSVTVGQEMFILPLSGIVESVRPAAGGVKSVTGRGRVVQVRGQYLPVVALHELFGIEGARHQEEDGILVIVDAGKRQFALLVDALCGQHQVVIKSLEANWRKVQGVSGATILGDGRVALILDPAELCDMALSPTARECVA
ncbi:MAG: chemotaxis protein CheW [Burkholderiales bacterium]|nr:chemotaxis protein CheW [Burkholderiales bacterium]